MSSFSGDWRLRQLAIKQLAFDRQIQTPEDYLEMEKDEQIAVRHGHISPRFFYGCDEDCADLLGSGRPLNSGLVLLRAYQMMREWLMMSAAQSGFLPEYVAHSLTHLEGCPACQERIVAQIIGDLEDWRYIRQVLIPLREDR